MRARAAAFLGAGLVVAALLHLPAWLGAPDRLPGSPHGDCVRAWWGLWVEARAFPRLPIPTELVAFPGGADLLPLPPLTGWLVAPVGRLADPTRALVALVTLHTFLAGLGGAALARTLGANRGGAALAAGLTATLPVLGEFLHEGTPEHGSLGWFGLALAAAIRGARGDARAGAAAGVLAVIAALESPYHASALALVAPLAVLVELRGRRGLGGLLAAGVGLALAAGAAWAVASPIIRHLVETSGGLVPPGAARQVIPAAEWDPLGRADPPGYPIPVLAWPLALLGLARARRSAAWLVPATAALLGLACGLDLLDPWFATPLGAGIIAPRRYLAPAGLLVAAAAGTALTADGWRRRAVPVLGLLAIVHGVLLGRWCTAYPWTALPAVPGFARAMIADPAPGAFVVFPYVDPDTTRRTQPRIDREPRLASPQARLALQVFTGRATRDDFHLVTLVPRPQPRLALDDGRLQGGELRDLVGRGLRWVLVDEATLGDDARAATATLARLGARCRRWSDWGGVTACRFPGP